MLHILRNLDWSVLWNLVFSVIPALLCITIHECSHGYVAFKLGDTTARDMGRLSLNPFKHFDILGFIMLAFVGFGWAKPVPIDMRRFKNPKQGMAISALAGPASNILLAIAALFLFGLLYTPFSNSTFGGYVIETLARTASMSVSFAVFNILPIPPLDGSKVLFSLISDRSYYKLMRYERYGMLLLFALVFTGVLNRPLIWASRNVLDKLMFSTRFGFAVYDLF